MKATRALLCFGAVVALGAVTLAVRFNRPNRANPSQPRFDTLEADMRTAGRSAARNPVAVGAAPGAEAPEAEPPPAVDYDWRLALREEKPPPKLPRPVVEAFLEKRQRSAESLLAAYHALADRNLLAEAAARFPNDPRVQRAMLSADLVPEDRRKWLELFKASSPDNSLANYLSAQELLKNTWREETSEWLFGPDKLPLQDYLKTSQAQLAINELVEATAKPQFKNYTLEARLDEEELNLASGRSAIQAQLGASGWAADLMPELAQFKSIAIALQQFEKAYLSVGDTASAQNLTQIGLTLAGRLRSGENGNLIINQLVGTASEAIHLNAWDANTRYDFLGGRTPKERLAEMKQERAAIRTLDESVRKQFAAMAEADLLSYLNRERVYGELEAMRWLQQRTRATATPAPSP